MENLDTKILMNNWKKITEYVKTHYHFSREIEFEWKHETFYKIEFGVTSKGIPFFAQGSHGRWGWEEYYFHPEHKTDEGMLARRLEEVEHDWKLIKQKLDELQKEEDALLNFNPENN